jgi:bifunctional non-homologous end joining protein LigD
MSTAASVIVGGRKLPVSNLDKPLYPTGFTKKQVIDYYLAISPAMLPYLRDRAVTLKRYPNGSQEKFFFEKNCPDHRPNWVKTADVNGGKQAGGNTHCMINDARSLAWAANLAALELHVPLAKAKSQDRPTMMVFDLDPGAPATLTDCVELGLKLRDVFKGLGLLCSAKTSGSKGLHVYVPLNTPGVTFDQTKDFARAIAMSFERQNPKRVTSNMSKAIRGGKVFVDWSQNDRHKTTACVYTLRATERPSVSTPVSWEELGKALRKDMIKALAFTPDQVIERVKKLGDLFLPVVELKQRLPA